jgi:hypothetical protein
MKRSEMLEIISKHLVNKDQHLALNKEQADVLAEHALAIAEKCGMLPPVVNTEAMKDMSQEDAISYFNYLKLEYVTVGWENED